MNNKILIGSIIAVAILVLVTTTSAVNVNISGDGFYELDDVKKYPVKFTIDGPTVVEEGELYLYTFYLSPNPESDWFDMALWWGEGCGFLYEHLPTGENYSEPHAWYRFPGDPTSFTIEATAYCGNSTYEATLKVGINARAKQTINLPTTSAVNVNFSGDNHPPDPAVHVNTIQNETLIELIIDGPTQGNVGELLEYILILTDPEGCEIWFFIDWDDGTNPDWFGPCMAGEEELVSKTWYECGIYNFSVQVEGCDGTMYSGTFEVTIIDNQPPIIPTIDGETQPRVGLSYAYDFISDDLDGDNVSYYIEWGDGNITDWTPFQTEGFPGYKESHSWDEIGTYTLRAKAKDIWGAESDWMYVSLKVPKSNQIINLPFLQFLERFPILNLLIMRLVEGWE